MEWFNTWSVWHWLALGFILLIAEILIPGVFLLWWGLAALIVSGIVLCFPTLSITAMVVIYAILAIMLSLIWWKYQHGKDRQDQSRTNLNQRDHAMLGKIGRVESIDPSGIGRGHFADTTWRIKGSGLQPHDIIQVTHVEGITLFVRKLEEKQ
ncbi:NfeD family protein [Conservatibacter flavescens]|uniref:NfeD-like C-terminal domain-containing protein n=1 Tax=Conservatibacter flavescens TaxID=28161 RepID=A0A2M8S555_9PAST|nr:NfeD family protein [Conservatibacter flavescens]PJG86272.1 hypothetical protein CVP05_00180 [Conservatibacter flavescens]